MSAWGEESEHFVLWPKASCFAIVTSRRHRGRKRSACSNEWALMRSLTPSVYLHCFPCTNNDLAFILPFVNHVTIDRSYRCSEQVSSSLAHVIVTSCPLEEVSHDHANPHAQSLTPSVFLPGQESNAMFDCRKQAYIKAWQLASLPTNFSVKLRM